MKQFLIANNITFENNWEKIINNQDQDIKLNDLAEGLFCIYTTNQKKTILCNLKFEDTILEEIKLTSGSLSSICDINDPIKITFPFTVQLYTPNQEIQETVNISVFSLFLTNQELSPILDIPVPMNELKVSYFPEQGFQVALDFTDILDVLGIELHNYPDKEVEFNPRNGEMFVVKGNSQNFRWRGNKLLCCLALVKHKIRFKLTKDQPWSDWIEFQVKRKMTL